MANAKHSANHGALYRQMICVSGRQRDIVIGQSARCAATLFLTGIQSVKAIHHYCEAVNLGPPSAPAHPHALQAAEHALETPQRR
jgi:hypothetical protein